MDEEKKQEVPQPITPIHECKKFGKIINKLGQWDGILQCVECKKISHIRLEGAQHMVNSRYNAVSEVKAVYGK